jgi:hypothetical protein
MMNARDHGRSSGCSTCDPLLFEGRSGPDVPNRSEYEMMYVPCLTFKFVVGITY